MGMRAPEDMTAAEVESTPSQLLCLPGSIRQLLVQMVGQSDIGAVSRNTGASDGVGTTAELANSSDASSTSDGRSMRAWNVQAAGAGRLNMLRLVCRTLRCDVNAVTARFCPCASGRLRRPFPEPNHMLAGMPCLQHLDISGQRLSFDGMEGLASALPCFTRLRFLGLQSTFPQGESGCGVVQALAHVTGLTYLDLSRNPDVLPASEQALVHVLHCLTDLRHLDLGICHHNCDDTLAWRGDGMPGALGQLTALTYLSVAFNNILDHGLEALALALARLHSLQQLSLAHTSSYPVHIPELLRAVGTLTALCSLNLSGLALLKEGQRLGSALAPLGQLTRLSLARTLAVCGKHEVREALLGSLSCLTALEHLSLQGNSLCDYGDSWRLWRVLGGLRRLTWLDISGNLVGIRAYIDSQDGSQLMQQVRLADEKACMAQLFHLLPDCYHVVLDCGQYFRSVNDGQRVIVQYN